MAQKRFKLEPTAEELQMMQQTLGADSPEFKAIIRDFALDKTPQEKQLDSYFRNHESKFDRRNPQFKKASGRQPQSTGPGMVDNIASEMMYEKYPASSRPQLTPQMMRQLEMGGMNTYNRPGGGFAVTDQAPPNLMGAVGGAATRALPAAGMVGAGMLYPSSIGQDEGQQVFNLLNQQAPVLGGPAINPKEIDAMITESMLPPSAPAPKEYYPAMDEEAAPMIQRSGFSSSMDNPSKTMTSSTKSKKAPLAKPKSAVNVDQMTQEFTQPDYTRGSPGFQQRLQGKMGQIPVNVDEEAMMEMLLNEATSTGSPMLRGSYPKRRK